MGTCWSSCECVCVELFAAVDAWWRSGGARARDCFLYIFRCACVRARSRTWLEYAPRHPLVCSLDRHERGTSRRSHELRWRFAPPAAFAAAAAPSAAPSSAGAAAPWHGTMRRDARARHALLRLLLTSSPCAVRFFCFFLDATCSGVSAARAFTIVATASCTSPSNAASAASAVANACAATRAHPRHCCCLRAARAGGAAAAAATPHLLGIAQARGLRDGGALGGRAVHPVPHLPLRCFTCRGRRLRRLSLHRVHPRLLVVRDAARVALLQRLIRVDVRLRTEPRK